MEDRELFGELWQRESETTRKVFERIPPHTAVDEASVEPLIRGQGYTVRYVPEAVVYNKGPDTVEDFLRQRRRIYAGHLEMQHQLGYSVSTMSGTKIAGPVNTSCVSWCQSVTKIACNSSVMGPVSRTIMSCQAMSLCP